MALAQTADVGERVHPHSQHRLDGSWTRGGEEDVARAGKDTFVVCAVLAMLVSEYYYYYLGRALGVTY
jgi:hypothetical protein